MKSNIKFILALGNSKLVMLQDKQGHSFYSHSGKVEAPVKRTSLRRIAQTLTQEI